MATLLAYPLLLARKPAAAHGLLKTPLATAGIPFRIDRREHEVNIAGVIGAVEPLEHLAGAPEAQATERHRIGRHVARWRPLFECRHDAAGFDVAAGGRQDIRPQRNRLAVFARQPRRGVGGRQRRLRFSALLVNLGQLVVTRPEIRVHSQRLPRVLECTVEVPSLRTAVADLEQGTYEFGVTVTLKDGTSAKDSLSIHVYDPRGPGANEFTFRNVPWLCPFSCGATVNNFPFPTTPPVIVLVKKADEAGWIEARPVAQWVIATDRFVFGIESHRLWIAADDESGVVDIRVIF